MLECSSQAHKTGVYNVMHSNGYINEKPLRLLCKYLDAANIDLKGFSNEIYGELMQGAFLDPVLRTLKVLKEEKVWVEITNLVIPTKNDDLDTIRKMCEWIKNNLGADVPIHFSRFHPMYKLTNLPPTPLETLEQAYNIAKKCGLYYVYIGNVPGHKAEDTFCHNCGKIVVDRYGYQIITNNIVRRRCKFCNTKISGVWTTK